MIDTLSQRENDLARANEQLNYEREHVLAYPIQLFLPAVWITMSMDGGYYLIMDRTLKTSLEVKSHG